MADHYGDLEWFDANPSAAACIRPVRNNEQPGATEGLYLLVILPWLDDWHREIFPFQFHDLPERTPLNDTQAMWALLAARAAQPGQTFREALEDARALATSEQGQVFRETLGCPRWSRMPVKGRA